MNAAWWPQTTNIYRNVLQESLKSSLSGWNKYCGLSLNVSIAELPQQELPWGLRNLKRTSMRFLHRDQGLNSVWGHYFTPLKKANFATCACSFLFLTPFLLKSAAAIQLFFCSLCFKTLTWNTKETRYVLTMKSSDSCGQKLHVEFSWSSLMETQSTIV